MNINKMAAATPRLLERKSFVAITGASRGLGRSIASKLVARFPPSSFFVFLARSIGALDELAAELSTSFPGVQIRTRQFDQGKLDQNIFDHLFVDILKDNNLSATDFDQAVIVHNCATLGDVSKYAWEMTDVTSLETFYDINVTGTILLNSTFLTTFSKAKNKLIVNITSDNSKIPYPTMSVYCSCKYILYY